MVAALVRDDYLREIEKVCGRCAISRLAVPLISPVTQSNCVFYDVEVEALRANDSSGKLEWTRLARKTASIDFFLTDDSSAAVYVYVTSGGVRALGRGHPVKVSSLNATQQQNVRVFLEGQGQKVSTSFTNLVVRERAFRLGEAVAALGVLELAGRLPELKPVCASVRDGAPDDDEMTEDDRRAWDLLLETHGGCCVVSDAPEDIAGLVSSRLSESHVMSPSRSSDSHGAMSPGRPGSFRDTALSFP